MKRYTILFILLMSLSGQLNMKAQVLNPATDARDSMVLPAFMDTLPRIIPDYPAPSHYLPRDRRVAAHPWTDSPFVSSIFTAHPSYGFSGSIGFGKYEINAPDRFFSSFSGYNGINIPQLFLSEQMMVGNTLRITDGFYFLSGILYGAQLGIAGNNWGMGTREGFIWNPNPSASVIFWTQYFQSVSVYSPVLFPDKYDDAAAIRMPATPEVFSFGVQANFNVGGFIIGVGTSVAPVPFQDRHHSEFRYK